MYISFFLMALIFLRQISIYKQPNKINYAPLILGIGGIASVIHFIIADEHQSTLLILQGSFIPFLVALMLYIIMNIMHQTQRAESERTQREFTLALIEQLSELKEFTQSLEERMQSYAKEELKLKEEFAAKFREDIETLAQLLHNQHQFMEKFEELRGWHKQLQELFINFTEFKLPELDGVVHKHIEMLRIANKEQFEKITTSLKSVLGTKESLEEELSLLQKRLEGIENSAESIASQIVHSTTTKLNEATKTLREEYITLFRHAETLKTELLASETKLEAIKTQSEFIIRQMVVVAKKMESFEEEKELLAKSVDEMVPLLRRIDTNQERYEVVLQEFDRVAGELSKKQQEFANELKEVITALPDEIEEKFKKLEQQVTSKSETVSESMKLLAKQAKLQQTGYGESD